MDNYKKSLTGLMVLKLKNKKLKFFLIKHTFNKSVVKTSVVKFVFDITFS